MGLERYKNFKVQRCETQLLEANRHVAFSRCYREDMLKAPIGNRDEKTHKFLSTYAGDLKALEETAYASLMQNTKKYRELIKLHPEIHALWFQYKYYFLADCEELLHEVMLFSIAKAWGKPCAPIWARPIGH